ncbi:MAG: single-stranded-DNA-specific exonuclease RecJ [Desulfobacterales bacterium]|nr:single-stranded-DNA-specific exonuclease RecJ [Desulfobacterales bacterium]
MKKRWHISEPDISIVNEIRSALHCQPSIAAILANRNIRSVKEAKQFLSDSLKDIRLPHTIKDMDKAVRRIYDAINKSQKILIFGDYDADGITATAVLYDFIKQTDVDVSYHIPHRISEGYGLKKNHISDIAVPNGIELIITVDCGSGSHDAVELANSKNIDIIITDHHNIFKPYPNAVAIINPKREDCSAGFEMLAGVGVAFYLVAALRMHLRDEGFWTKRKEPNLKRYCDLVALGTIADVVPLHKENRILTNAGLEVLNTGNRIGLRSLVKAAGNNGTAIVSEDIAFRLAPRINAAGRIGHANTAFELILSGKQHQATRLAETLNKMNIDRQDIEQQMLEDIFVRLDENPEFLKGHTLVLSDDAWHEGVLGIVASRLAERFYRPVVLISTANGIGKGSARSIPGIDLYRLFKSCEDDLEAFGGHAMAAGLTINKKDINCFCSNFDKAAEKSLFQCTLVPKIEIDFELNLKEISPLLMDQLEMLQPFGEGNREPLFMARNIHVVSSDIVGKAHRRMKLSHNAKSDGHGINAIYFNVDPEKAEARFYEKIAFHLRWNRWNGNKSLQIIVEET